MPPSPRASILCIGHPLIDMQVRDAEAERILAKYKLKRNDAILAGEEHEMIYEDISQDDQVVYVAGGAALNTARGAAYILPPNSVAFAGCVGDDELALRLIAANDREGVLSAFQVEKGKKTGACAVVVTGQDRSLVTTLRAASLLDTSHLFSPTVLPLVDGAKVLYIEGYLLTHELNAEVAVELAKRSKAESSADKILVLNFSAPYVLRLFSNKVQEILPYCDIVIANEAEAKAWAEAYGSTPVIPSLATIAKDISLFHRAPQQLDSVLRTHPRLVIITHGSQSTVVVSSIYPDSPRVYPVPPLKKEEGEEIVDTNAAGDAFAGGVCASLSVGSAAEKEDVLRGDAGYLNRCIETGHKLARMCIGQVGGQYKWPKEQIV